jgi:leucyl-tRNA synthetase
MNTAISQLMICHNFMTDQKDIPREMAQIFTILLSPFAPHISEELWELLGKKASISHHAWPKADPQYLIKDKVSFAIQVNGKLRDKIEINKSQTADEIKSLVVTLPKVAPYLEGKQLKQVVYVPERLANIVVVG